MNIIRFPSPTKIKKVAEKKIGYSRAEEYAAMLLQGEYSPDLANELAGYLDIPDNRAREFDKFLMTLDNCIRAAEDEED